MFRNVTLLLWIGFYLRICVAAWNSFIEPSLGAGGDALTFHLIAVEHSYNLDIDKWGDSSTHFYPLKIGWCYPYFLGVVYAITTPALFIGCLLSVVVWTASAYILARIMLLLSFVKSHQTIVMLIYALLPSSVFHTSVTLREPYQLFFVNLAIYAFLKIYLNKSLVYWSVLLCSVIGMGILHGVLVVFGVSLLVATLFMLSLRYRQSGKNFSFAKLVIVVPVIICVVIYGMSFFKSYSYGSYGTKQQSNLHTKIEGFQTGLILTGGGARSNYKSRVVLNSGSDLLFFLPVNFFQYLFEPVPWHITNTFDILVMLENVLRALLLLMSLKWLRVALVQGNRAILVVFLFYFFIEAMWSLGTVNWGNAVRHHIPSIGLMLIVAFANMRASHSRKAKHIK